jgi:hypothetical protein
MQIEKEEPLASPLAALFIYLFIGRGLALIRFGSLGARPPRAFFDWIIIISRELVELFIEVSVANAFGTSTLKLFRRLNWR